MNAWLRSLQIKKIRKFTIKDHHQMKLLFLSLLKNMAMNFMEQMMNQFL